MPAAVTLPVTVTHSETEYPREFSMSMSEEGCVAVSCPDHEKSGLEPATLVISLSKSWKRSVRTVYDSASEYEIIPVPIGPAIVLLVNRRSNLVVLFRSMLFSNLVMRISDETQRNVSTIGRTVRTAAEMAMTATSMKTILCFLT